LNSELLRGFSVAHVGARVKTNAPGSRHDREVVAPGDRADRLDLDDED